MELRRYGKVQGPIVGKWLHGGMIKFFDNRKKRGLQDGLGDPHIKVVVSINYLILLFINLSSCVRQF